MVSRNDEMECSDVTRRPSFEALVSGATQSPTWEQSLQANLTFGLLLRSPCRADN